MLTEIRLTNFRKFESYVISCKKGNVLVGPNNAGKSGIIEALRILDNCIRLTKRKVPYSIQVPSGDVLDGFLIPESSIDVELSHSSHNYIDSPSIIEYKIANGTKAIVIIKRDEQVKFLLDGGGPRINSVSKVQKYFPLELTIVPTLGPLEREESFVQDETIKKSISKKTSSRHFRNVWYRKTQTEFDNFAVDVASAWPDISIQKPERNIGDRSLLEMFYSENRYDREVRWAGFGFQIWLQILTHLSRAGSGSVVVIDEPDIYLHPEIQKKLLRLLRERFSQFIMATHSVEIINEADEMEVVSINSKYKNAKRIKSEEDYNNIRIYVGSSTNSDFARVAKAKKVVFVEGEDRKIMQMLARRLNFPALAASTVPFVKLGGFQGWEKALGAVWAFKEILDLDIEVFCLFDSDYRCSDEIKSFEQKICSAGLQCKVLGRKEIENYFLDFDILHDSANKRSKEKSKNELDKNFLYEILDDITGKIKSRVFAQRGMKAVDYFKSIGDKRDAATISQLIHEETEMLWADITTRLHICPGKEVLSELNSRLQASGLGSLTMRMISEHIKAEKFDRDFFSVLSELDSFCQLK
ncbi:AAA family ATPase [Pararhizobium sp. BT-229]|uniref:ATP-dependent nuclease n=1 Tax=Pararhizobium sp. BT-229 TaxID=2986923 RepID=UPI0021F6AB41|nr:AAA family ATPase [Pararhizobium sp. BT-229]MCV9960702.1 AAA family ATPase [Pararhizobium sp. BT-229]